MWLIIDGVIINIISIIIIIIIIVFIVSIHIYRSWQICHGVDDWNGSDDVIIAILILVGVNNYLIS